MYTNFFYCMAFLFVLSDQHSYLSFTLLVSSVLFDELSDLGHDIRMHWNNRTHHNPRWRTALCRWHKPHRVWPHPVFVDRVCVKVAHFAHEEKMRPSRRMCSVVCIPNSIGKFGFQLMNIGDDLGNVPNRTSEAIIPVCLGPGRRQNCN